MNEDIELLRSAEEAAVRARYARRSGDFLETGRYHPVLLDRLISRQQKERVIADFLRKRWLGRIGQLRVLEIGCESGGTLQMLFGLGINPARAIGLDLLEEHIDRAKRRLPSSCVLLQADGLATELPLAGFDLVVQSTVFSSVLDSRVRHALAERMVSLIAPGGVILWYDISLDNPQNPDVLGISVLELRSLFPGCTIRVRRLTLAPPIARMVGRMGYAASIAFGLIPFLRSHLLAWIEPAGKETTRPGAA